MMKNIQKTEIENALNENKYSLVKNYLKKLIRNVKYNYSNL